MDGAKTGCVERCIPISGGRKRRVVRTLKLLLALKTHTLEKEQRYSKTFRQDNLDEKCTEGNGSETCASQLLFNTYHRHAKLGTLS